MVRRHELVHHEITGRVISAAFEVHSVLGVGLLESVYEAALAEELARRSIAFGRQCSVPLVYKGRPLGKGFRVDLIVEQRVIVEVKSVDRVIPAHFSQLITYMRLTGLRVGLLLNFNVPDLRNGIHRRVV